MRQRPLGFSRCFVEVLVKLTGAPGLASDPSVAKLAEHADEFVASFAYVDPRAGLLHHDDQGTYDRSHELTVRFDPVKIDAVLASLGVAIWRGPRPLLTPVILVRDRDPTPFLLSARVARGEAMRQAIVRSAAECGIGVHFPTESELAEWAVGTVGFPAPLGDAAAGQLRVVGTLSWNVRAMGWVAEWRAPLNGAEHGWGISGVGFDEALATLVRGAVMLAAGTGIP